MKNLVSFEDTFNAAVSQWNDGFDRDAKCVSSCPKDEEGKCYDYGKCCGDYRGGFQIRASDSSFVEVVKKWLFWPKMGLFSPKMTQKD